MRVCVTGGRDFKGRDALFRVLDALPVTVMIHGKCQRGSDQFADDWATMNEIPVEAYAPVWANGRQAGPLRNERMLRDGRPQLVVGCRGGAGTDDCLRRARKMGIEIMMVGWN